MRTEPAKLSLAERDRAMKDLREALLNLIDKDVPVTSWSFDEDRGVAVVALDDPTERHRDQVRALWDIVGIRLIEERQSKATACTYRTGSPCSPVRGGIGLRNGADANGAGCSAAYVGTAGGSTRYLVTAGHCHNSGNAHWFLNNRTTVVGIQGMYVDRNDVADAMRINLDGNPSTDNLLFVDNSTTGRTMTSRRNNSSQQVGDTACLSARSGYHCGTIQETGLAGGVGGRMQFDMVRTSVPSDFGDSGGAVFVSTAWLGIAIGKTPSNRLLYSKQQNVKAVIFVEPCITAGC